MPTDQADPKHFQSIATIDARLAEIEHESGRMSSCFSPAL